MYVIALFVTVVIATVAVCGARVCVGIMLLTGGPDSEIMDMSTLQMSYSALSGSPMSLRYATS